MTALEYFRLLAPEFSTVSDATVNVWIGVAGNLANTDCLESELANMALALYAAHLQWVTKNQGNGSSYTGSVIEEKEGDLMRKYGSVKGSNTWLGMSPYGQQYINATAPCYGFSAMTRIG